MKRSSPTPASSKPAPKLQATRTRPPEQAKGAEHEERLLDEAIDESFPASDPPAISTPKSRKPAGGKK